MNDLPYLLHIRHFVAFNPEPTEEQLCAYLRLDDYKMAQAKMELK
jgi:hypothetical protein